MINPADILAASKAAAELGPKWSSSMSEPFNQAVPSMSVPGAQNATQIMNGVQEAGSQIWALMGDLGKSVNDQVATHQEKQRAEQTYDFKPDMSDLRPTDLKGMPKELSGEFFARFMK